MKAIMNLEKVLKSIDTAVLQGFNSNIRLYWDDSSNSWEIIELNKSRTIHYSGTSLQDAINLFCKLESSE